MDMFNIKFKRYQIGSKICVQGLKKKATFRDISMIIINLQKVIYAVDLPKVTRAKGRAGG